MTVTTELMTAEELLRLPANGLRTELIKGELRTMPPAGMKHGKYAMLLSIPLGQHILEHQLGMVYAAETGYIVARNPDTVRAPDLSFVRQETLDLYGEPDSFGPYAPDLAVEVISPNDVYIEVEEKVFEWLEAGTRMVITINPRKKLVTVYRSLLDVKILTENDLLDGADVIPGWQMPVRKLFSA